MNLLSFIFIIISLLSVSGCYQTFTPQNANFVAASQLPPADPAPAPVVVQVPKPMPLPGQLKKISAADRKSKKKTSSDPLKVIAKNNRLASQKPNDFGFFNSIMQYDYDLGALYQIYCAPLRLTDIQLQPGEKILGKPAAGDTVRWVMGLGKSQDSGGVEQQHLYVKPTRPDLDTTLCINTDRRSYLIELHSYSETYMAAVNWRYPHDEIAMIEQQASLDGIKSRQITSPIVSVEDLNFNYDVEVEHGSKPKWMPVKVFDDGKKTFIQFPKEMLVREAPALFVLSTDDSTQLVNYRVKNEFYVVDRLFDKAELRLGQKDQTIVRISKV